MTKKVCNETYVINLVNAHTLPRELIIINEKITEEIG